MRLLLQKSFSSFYIVAAAYLLLALIILTKFSGLFIPFVVLSSVVSLAAITIYLGFKNTYPLLMCCLPLGINVFINASTGIILPSEPLLAAFSLASCFLLVMDNSSGIRLYNHKVFIVIAIYLGLTLVSVLFSEMPVISIKAFSVKLIYTLGFFVGGYYFFKETGLKGFTWYLWPFLLVAVIILIRHASFDFSKDIAGFVTKPFFKDHTIYSASLVFMVPLCFGLMSLTKKSFRWLYVIVIAFLLFAIFISSCRAAWISLIAGALFYFILTIRVKFRTLMIFSGLLFLVAFVNSDSLVEIMKSNRYDSSAKNAGLETQTLSITNINNDQSNAERLNRWKCALRMFNVKPLTGFGPGTFQFTYLPFQRDYELTRISVVSPYNIKDGRGGTAHQEFLLVLAEAGLPAFIAFVLVVLLAFQVGMRTLYRLVLPQQKIALQSVLIAFTTYVVHSCFNNFLDTDKSAVLFFGSLAFIVLMDIQSRNHAS